MALTGKDDVVAMQCVPLEHAWQAIRALTPTPGESDGKDQPVAWTRFLVHSADTVLKAASNACLYPSCEATANNHRFLITELPMPAMTGDSARLEGIEVWKNDSVVDSLVVKYACQYPLGDPANGSVASAYEGFFDLLLNDTLFVVRDIIKADLPRSLIIYWDDILSALREKTDEDPARHALIVDLAKTVLAPLDHVTKQPKKILKRVRDQQRVQCVQEVDVDCLIDLARRPGTTMPEKAGPKQRILAITRYETVDLLENRVAKHCCELLCRAAGRYLRSHQHVHHSARKATVANLFRTSKRLPQRQSFVSVGRLHSPCRHPNNALLQNLQYSRIWQAYSKLVRNEELRENIWRWPRRLWADRVGIYVADTVLGWCARASFPVFIRTAHRVVQATASHISGKWFVRDVMPGPFVIYKSPDDGGTLHLTDGPSVCVIDKGLACTAVLNADFLAVWISAGNVRVLPIYAVLPSPAENPACNDIARSRMAEDVIECLINFRTQSPTVFAVGALLVHGIWGAESRGARWQTAGDGRGWCWQVGLSPDAREWPVHEPERFLPFNTLVTGR